MKTKLRREDITGILYGDIFSGIGFGKIYDDQRGRFPDGSDIHTSEVKGVISARVLITRNSVYLLLDDTRETSDDED